MIITPSEMLEIGSKALNYKLQEWGADPEISEEKWNELYDQVEHNFSRLQWICQLGRETLLRKDLEKECVGDNFFFEMLKRDFEWDWSCEIDFRNYWPFGLSYKTEEILAK